MQQRSPTLDDFLRLAPAGEGFKRLITQEARRLCVGPLGIDEIYEDLKLVSGFRKKQKSEWDNAKKNWNRNEPEGATATFLSILYWIYEKHPTVAEDLFVSIFDLSAGETLAIRPITPIPPSVPEPIHSAESAPASSRVRLPAYLSRDAYARAFDEKTSINGENVEQHLSKVNSSGLSAEEQRNHITRDGSVDMPGLTLTSGVVKLPFANMVDAPPRNQDFTGRIEELNNVHASLSNGRGRAAIIQSDAGTGRTTIAGLGGIGKTTLAIEYISKYKDHYDGVWWCRSETSEDLVASLHRLATKLKIVPENDSDAQKAAKFCLQWLDDNNICALLVYDNVPNPAILAGLLPFSAPRVLITSRFPDWGGWADQVELDVWPNEDALDYISRRMPRSDAAHAQALADALGKLPLALDHALAYCARTQTRLDEYAQKSASLIAELPSNRPYPRSVAATFALNIAAAVCEQPSAALLMRIIGYCGPDRIPSSLLHGVVSNDLEVVRGLQALSSLSLIKADAFPDGTAAWKVHRLVQAVARSQSSEYRDSIITGIGVRLSEMFPTNTYNEDKDWTLCEKLMPHVRGVFNDSDNAANESFVSLFDAAGLYLLARGFLPQSSAFLFRALVICRLPTYSNQKVLSRVLSNVSLLLHTQGKLKEAIPYCKDALSLRKRLFGLKSVDTLTSLNNLAYLYMDLMRYKESKPLFEKCLKYTEQLFTRNHHETATALDNLSLLYRRMGLLKRAFRLSKNALRIRIKEQGENHIDTAFSYDSVAGILYAVGRKEAALHFWSRSEDVYVEKYGKYSIQAAKVSINKALIISDYEDHELALVQARDSLSVLENWFGLDHIEYAQAQEMIATILIRLDKINQAIDELGRAANVYFKTFGGKNSETERCERRINQLNAASQ